MTGKPSFRARWCAGLLLALAAPLVRAEVKPNGLFTSNMVLQQGMAVPVWGTAAPGEAVTVRFQGQEAATVARPDGTWRVDLARTTPGGPFELTIAGTNTLTLTNVMVGEVWIASGQSNMQWSLRNSEGAEEAIANSANPNLRLFQVPLKHSEVPLTEVTGAWNEAKPDTVPNFSGVAYFFGRKLQRDLGVPVGIIQTAWGGTPAEAWTRFMTMDRDPELRPILDRYHQAILNHPQAYRQYQEQLAKWQEEAAKAKAEGKPEPRRPSIPYGPLHQNRPAALYNAMIAPLVPYAIRGAIWYQGESNAGRAWEYRRLFPTMIQDWRNAWREAGSEAGDFSFYFVQLAPYMAINPEPMDSAWAELREAQWLTERTLPHTGMAVITDVGDETDIHPRRKLEVGERLALLAEARTYRRHVDFSGPQFDTYRIGLSSIRVWFRYADRGLVAKDGELKGFTIAGSDGKFHNAQARIDGNSVVVWSPEVPRPRYVRYGWANYPVGNLWNAEGLPASPFRTDTLPLTTQPKPQG